MKNFKNPLFLPVKIHHRILNSLFVVSLLISNISAAEDKNTEAQITRFSFLAEKFDVNNLKLYGDRPHRFIRPSPEGLRTKLSDKDKVAPIGFGPHFEIPGDFRITATYKIETLETPPSGYGVGPEIYIGVEGGTSATIGRICRNDGKNVYKAHRAVGAGNERKHSVRMFDTHNMEGQLRLERKGETLVYSVSDKPNAQFRVIHSNKFSVSPLRTLRVGSSQGDANVNLHFLWKDLEISVLPTKEILSDTDYSLVTSLFITIGILLVVIIMGIYFIMKTNILAEIKNRN